MDFSRLVDISRALKDKNQTGTYFHTSFAIKKNRIIAITFNKYGKTHPLTIDYIPRKASRHNKIYQAALHAEARIIIKLGEIDYSRITIVNIRVGNDLTIRNSKPCPGCEQLLAGFQPKNVFYTNDFGEFVELN